MMASPSELSLDCKPHSYSLLLRSFPDQPDPTQTQKLEDFLARLEEERLKIEVFKRELPLCMQLLTEAVEASRQQLQSYRANQGARPFLEEFIPLKHSTPEGPEKASNISDKANWMTSAQLWSTAGGGDDQTNQQLAMASCKETDIGFTVSPKLGFDNKQRNGGGGAFLPFSKDRNSRRSPNLRALPDLALANSTTTTTTATDHHHHHHHNNNNNNNEEEVEDKKCSETENGIAFSRRENCGGKVVNGGATSMEQVKAAAEAATTAAPAASGNSQTHRKARRCWSPDLHRRFVNALQMLGGSQVATPKQIRELMKVDGLTNDEVKSHLQKYRLHTRRPSPSPQAAGAAAPQLVVLGGIWVPPEYATAAAHTAAPTLYGAHPPSHASPHYCGPPVPQDFYAAAAAAAPSQAHLHHHHHQMHHHSLHHHHHQMHHHSLHHHHHQQLHMYKASPQTQNSPDSEVRAAGDRSESIEDGKSESSSWKGESGDNGGGERKGLSALRDDGEESNIAMEVRLLSTSNF